MDIFLSWSGDRSNMIAKIFYDWITNVIPQVDVYYSSEKIIAGKRWSESIQNGLKDNPVGIFFVVKENVTSSWLNFEAGAISNSVDNTHVIPMLHELKPTDISGPLTQFQAVTFEKDKIKEVVFIINSSLKDNRKISVNILNTIFEKWYPDFDSKYKEFTKSNPYKDTETTENKKTDIDNRSGLINEKEQVSEILDILREMQRVPLYSDNIRYPNSTARKNNVKISYDKRYKKESSLFIDDIEIKFNTDFFKENKNLDLFTIKKLILNLTRDLGRIPSYEEVNSELDLPISVVREVIDLGY